MNLFVTVLADEPLGCLHHTDDEQAEYAEDNDQAAGSEVQVSPAPVVGTGAFGDGRVRVTRVVAHEAPGQEPGDGVAHGPPYRHEGYEPRVCRR